jgi:aspartate racemase
MIKKFGIQGLILGGTELPFILRNPSDKKFQYLDTTKIHVERVVAEILSG